MTRTNSAPTAVPQLMLPGQAAAPGGPIDMTVMYVMHHGFRRDLTRFADAVPATPLDDRATWSALAARWALMAGVLVHHHTAEDNGVWPVLLDRADPDEVSQLLAMEDEHSQLDPALDAVAEGLAGLADGSRPSGAQARSAVADDVETARTLLFHHLAHEERDAIRIIQRHLSEQEWQDIERSHFQRRPAPASVRFLVPWFLDDVPREHIRTIVRTVGAPVALIWRLSRRSYERRENRAFRYTRP